MMATDEIGDGENQSNNSAVNDQTSDNSDAAPKTEDAAQKKKDEEEQKKKDEEEQKKKDEEEQKKKDEEEQKNKDVVLKNDTWLIKSAGPILALGTVTATFLMFAHFVSIASSPFQEVADVNICARDMAMAQDKLDEASSTLKGVVPAADKSKLEDEIKKQTHLVARAKIQCDFVKASLENAKERHATMKEIILVILGVLSSALTTILGFYFGSSKGSSDKSNALNEIAKKTASKSS